MGDCKGKKKACFSVCSFSLPCYGLVHVVLPMAFESRLQVILDERRVGASLRGCAEEQGISYRLTFSPIVGWVVWNLREAHFSNVRNVQTRWTVNMFKLLPTGDVWCECHSTVWHHKYFHSSYSRLLLRCKACLRDVSFQLLFATLSTPRPSKNALGHLNVFSLYQKCSS